MNENIILTPNRALPNAGDTFCRYADLGHQKLSQHRDKLISPENRKSLRTFSPAEACKLIGRSNTWVRNQAPSVKNFTLGDINNLRTIAGTLYKRPAGSQAIVTAVANFKGGVAKTTTTIHLAQKCALEGLRVLVLDFDPQASCTFSLGNKIPDLEITYDQTIAPILLDDSSLITAAIQPTYFHGVDLIPSNLSLAITEHELTNPEFNNHAKMGAVGNRLHAALAHIKDRYDVILIDCGPNLGALTINALMASNALLVPVPPGMLDLASMVSFMATMDNLFSQTDKSLDFFSIVLTKHPLSSQSQQVEALMREMFSGNILANAMAMTVELEKSSSAMGTIYDSGKPRTNRETYSRALMYADAVNMEVIDGFKQIWSDQSSIG